uniref:Chromosome transmission fidelity factor 18 n=1 Tax=Bubo bubo TaxID=30461 RepID=A0A8C0EYE2_BUBBB
APKPKRQRLEAVKKLNFGADDELAPDVRWDAGPEAPQTASGMAPLQTTPPSKKQRVLKRPPILEDYINVTSTEGTRVFMVVKDDPFRTGVEVPDSLGWNARRPLHLLGVPFSYLKEQVDEERRRRVLEASQQSLFAHSIPSLGSPAEPTDEEESALHCLWVDKFMPRRYMELLSDDYTNRCLLKWLKLWDTVVFGKERAVKAKPSTEAHPPFSQPKEQQNKWKTKVQLTEEILEAELDQHKRPKYKVALLCGPPGLGKTTLAHVIAKHAGYNAVEMNASDDRSPEVFKTRIEAATQMKSVLGTNEKPNCLIIDEIDGAPAASINVLLNIIHHKDAEGEAAAGTGRRRRREGGLLLRPIICICNDQYVPALRPLRQQSFLLNFPRTAPSRLAQRLCEITLRQGMRADTGALLALCEKTENDIRSCINTLKFVCLDALWPLSLVPSNLHWDCLQSSPQGFKYSLLLTLSSSLWAPPRHRIGMDPAVPTQLLVGDEDLSHLRGMAAFNASSHRFHHILHLAVSSGEQEKLAQGLYDNFLNMKLRDSSLSSVCLALEWLSFSDLLSRAVLHGQSFQLMRYLPFLPVAFHLLFAATTIPRLAYPSSQHEASPREGTNLVVSMVSGITPSARSRAGQQPLVLEVLCLLLDIIAPKLRPVNTQLYSLKEKQQLADLISTMLAYNLTYHQERLPEGQYVYKLDPNVEDVCRFPDLPARRQLTYQAKQLIAREIELEKMRRTEALLQARNLSEVGSPGNGLGERGDTRPVVPPNHQQRLEHIVRRAAVEDKVRGLQFLPRFLPAPPSPEEALESQMGKAVGKSDVWFRFNEGVSNAVRRNIYIKDLL